MGTEITQAQIERLESAKSDIATAIENKGVTVPSGTKVDGFAALIEQIEGGGSPNGKVWTQSNVTTSNLYLGYADGVWYADGYKSYDGMTWEPNETLLGEISSTTKYEAETGVIVGTLGNVSEIGYSLDGGETWIPCDITVTAVRSIYNANGMWVLADRKGLAYSPDGINWRRSDFTSSAVSVYNEGGIWVAATTKGLYYSKSWEFKE